LHARFINISRLQASRQFPKEYINAEGGKDQPLTLSLWKGRNTNRPRNRRAPVLREMTSGVSRPQVVLATDLATAVRLENDFNLLDFSPSTLLEDLRPAKQLACTTALETTFLLPADREGTPVATLEVAQAAISSHGRQQKYPIFFFKNSKYSQKLLATLNRHRKPIEELCADRGNKSKDEGRREKREGS
jgi:hypothetical protein